MAKILIVYATCEGQTAHIAHEIAGALRADGHEAEVSRAQDAPSPSGYGAVVVGSPVHAGRHERAVLEWVKTHLEVLEKTHGGFFSVSLAAASEDPNEQAEAKRLADAFLFKTGWRPESLACFAGALAYSRYGLLKKLIMRRIAAKEGGATDTAHDYEYTDWDSVLRFARDVAATVPAASAKH
ncbi:MAG: protoporphyrinogen oxidase [Acidobacteria bacterium]|nr:protoporphyrinogen oxidase [Acidobacteriota bacterium]